MYDIVCVGNALIDAFLGIHEANQYLRRNTETEELCIKYGEKIPLDSAKFLPGGNANNVSVGMAKLGLKAALIAEIGTDEFAEKVIRHLREARVDTSHIIQTPGHSSFAISLNFQGERTLFVEHVYRKHQFVFNELQTKWIYLSSLGKEWHHVYEHMAAFVQATGVKLAFNPGTAQIAEGAEMLHPVLQATEVLFLNKEEAQRITGKKEEKDIKMLLFALQALGPKIVVITDGEQGSFALAPDQKRYHLGTYQTTVTEKTGAGDAFATGFTASLMHGNDIPTALQWGAANAASVIEHVGSQPGQLTKQEIQERIGMNTNVMVQQI